MKKLNGWTMVALVLALVFGVCAVAQAVKVQRLPLQESVALAGSTHRVILTHEDLTLTTTNGAAQTVALLTALNKQGVELVASVLRTPFLSTTQTGLVSVLVKVGDAGDDDRFLADTQVCSHDTEVYLKYGRSQGALSAVTPTPVTLIYDKGGVTNGGTNVVVASIASTAGVDGRLAYTTDTAINAVVTPTAGTFALSDLTQGEVWLYFRVTDAR